MMQATIASFCPLLQVYDMAQAVRFYCAGLGFDLVDDSGEIDAPEGRYFHWALLRLGPANLMLNTAYDAGERPAARDKGRESGHADIMLYLNCSDVDAVFDELKGKGLAAKPPQVAPYGMKQLLLCDPDGYGVCFQQPV